MTSKRRGGNEVGPLGILEAHHAVYVEALGVYCMYCGHIRRPTGISHQTTVSAARCLDCRFRLRCAFLVPDSLKALRNDAVNGLPERYR